jgi:hypothetical protein
MRRLYPAQLILDFLTEFDKFVLTILALLAPKPSSTEPAVLGALLTA